MGEIGMELANLAIYDSSIHSFIFIPYIHSSVVNVACYSDLNIYAHIHVPHPPIPLPSYAHRLPSSTFLRIAG